MIIKLGQKLDIFIQSKLRLKNRVVLGAGHCADEFSQSFIFLAALNVPFDREKMGLIARRSRRLGSFSGTLFTLVIGCNFVYHFVLVVTDRALEPVADQLMEPLADQWGDQ